MTVFSTLKKYLGNLLCSAKQQTDPKLRNERTPAVLPVESLLPEGSSVDVEVEPSFSGTSVDALSQPSSSEEPTTPSPPPYSSCKGSSDEIIKYLGVPAPTPSQHFNSITKCLFKFMQPFLKDDYELLVKKEAVSLEMATCDGVKTFGASICVDNRDYHKEVIVRMTTDGWKTQRDIPAVYVLSDADYNIDKFEVGFEAEGNVEFAILYRVNGECYWDNNLGENYSIALN